MSWWNGACLCAMQPIQLIYAHNYIRNKQITVWFSVPSAINRLRTTGLLKPNSLPSLRISLFCGEILTKVAVVNWQHAACNSIIDNMYGPTELTIACAVYRWDPIHSPPECHGDIVPIGQLYEHLKGIMVDQHLSPIYGESIKGELCVIGPQLFSGYWKDQNSTNKVFLAVNTQKYYRTGDIVIKKNLYV